MNHIDLLNMLVQMDAPGGIRFTKEQARALLSEIRTLQNRLPMDRRTTIAKDILVQLLLDGTSELADQEKMTLALTLADQFIERIDK
jgi:hypothetical protein